MCPAVERPAFHAVELRTSAAFPAVELSGDWRGLARTSPPWGERLRGEDTRASVAWHALLEEIRGKSAAKQEGSAE